MKIIDKLSGEFFIQPFEQEDLRVEELNINNWHNNMRDKKIPLLCLVTCITMSVIFIMVV